MNYISLARALESGRGQWVITSLEKKNLGEMTWGGQPPEWLSACGSVPCRTLGPQGQDLLVEYLSGEKRLLICGGGHVSVHVAALGLLLGYQVTVVDDRPEFTQSHRFPPKTEVVCAPFVPFLADYPWEKAGDLSVVIVTRGHVADTDCLREAVKHPLSYLGMIGSKRKNQAIFDLLSGEGVLQENLDRVHAPIGLDIGAQTPEEIAVAIAGEWIAERRDCPQMLFSQEIRRALLSGVGGIMLTVTDKRGSAPRGIGARMFLGWDGRAYGTIGGGPAEYQAISMARAMGEDAGPVVTTFCMSSGEAGKWGMICGGEMDVLFQPVFNG